MAALAFTEYEKIVDGIGAKVPFWTALLVTLLSCAMVPFQWLDISSILAVALLLVALNVLQSDRVGTPILADTAAAVLAPVYIGLPLGALVGVHAMAGREAVLLLIATVAVSDTAQFYTGRAFGRTPLAPLRSPKKTREGAIGGLIIAPIFLAVAGSYWLPIAPPLWLAGARPRHCHCRDHRRPVRVDAEARRRHERQRHVDSRPRRRARSHRRAAVRGAGVLFLPAGAVDNLGLARLRLVRCRLGRLGAGRVRTPEPVPIHPALPLPAGQSPAAGSSSYLRNLCNLRPLEP